MSGEMKQKIITTLILLLVINISNAQSSNNLSDENLINDEQKISEILKFPKLDARRVTGLAYSSIVPGSGQIYLGYKTKGAAFAIGFFTGLVGTIVSHNNFIGNRERIQSLQFDYLNADRYTLAEYYWKQMVSVHNEQKTNERARNIFMISTGLIWTLNIIDYLFFTEDKGPIEFSNNNSFNNSFSILSITVPLNK